MKSIIFLALFLLVATASVLFVAVGLAKDGRPEFAAIENIEIGKTKKLSEIFSFSAQNFCVLQPYQDRVTLNSAFTERVNRYLSERNYVSSEGNFSFVMIGEEEIEVFTIDRSNYLDLLVSDKVTSSVEMALPKGFVPQDCARSEFASLLKIRAHERNYVVLGEMYQGP